MHSLLRTTAKSYFHYYVCASQVKASASPHKNHISVGLAEESILETVRELVEPHCLLESCLESAWERFQNHAKPELDSLNINKDSLTKNQEQVDNLVNAIANVSADGALFEMLNRKASELRMEREKLLIEQRHLQKSLAHLQSGLSAETFRNQLISWTDVMQEVRPEEKQRLIRLLVRKIEWQPEGNQAIEFFALPQ